MRCAPTFPAWCSTGSRPIWCVMFHWRRPQTPATGAVGPRPDPPAVRRSRVPGAARPAVRHPGAAEPEADEGFDVRVGALAPGAVGGWLARTRAVAGVRVSRWWHARRLRRGRHRARDRDRRRRGRLHRHHHNERRGRGRAGIVVVRPGSTQGPCNEAKVAIHDWPAAAGILAGSPPTPRWRPTWSARGSAASPSMISPCATCVASCARKPKNSNSFRCWTTPRASTTRRCRP